MIHVTKRSGAKEPFSVGKIQARIEGLAANLTGINMAELVGRTSSAVYNGITTEEIDYISADIAVCGGIKSTDYSILAARLIVSNLHKSTPGRFSEATFNIQNKYEVFDKEHTAFIRKHAAALDALIDDSADYKYTYLGMQVMMLGGYLFTESTRRIDSRAIAKLCAATGVTQDEIANFKASPTLFTQIPSKLFAKECGTEELAWAKTAPKELIIAAGWLLLPEYKKPIDRPQYMLMRMAITVGSRAKYPINEIGEIYRALSQLKYIHGSSSLYNAIGKRQQMLNCFLLKVDDSTEGILSVGSDTARISREGGGIGISLDNLRGAGQLIKSTRGAAAGVVRVMKMYEETLLTFNQGGRRPGAGAVYLSTHHSDILEFLRSADQNAPVEIRAAKLFRGVMATEHFYRAWIRKKNYALFSEDSAPGLMYVYDGMRVCKHCGYCRNPNYSKYITGVRFGPVCAHEYGRVAAFSQLYKRYKNERRYTSIVPAALIADTFCDAKVISTGAYMLNKDAINRRSRQEPTGTIIMSNLCAEIVEYTDSSSTACCTLASCVIDKYLRDGVFDFVDFMRVVELSIRALDTVVDINVYPTPQTHNNNLYFRPLGLGIQGMADVFRKMQVPFESAVAEQLDVLIHEAMYYAALSASYKLAVEKGPCRAWTDSKIHTVPEYKLWMEDMAELGNEFAGADPRGWMLAADNKTLLGWKFPISREMWAVLEQNITKSGVRNTYLRANMPTVNTGDITGSNGPSGEPVNFNIFNKTTIRGAKLIKVDENMVSHLTSLGVWSDELADAIINDPLARLPAKWNVNGWDKIREIYKTAYEVSQKSLMRRSCLRQAFIDQTQSLNQFLPTRDMTKLRGIIQLGFMYGLKTISYYTRMPAAPTHEQKMQAEKQAEKQEDVCRRDDPNCAACSQ